MATKRNRREEYVSEDNAIKRVFNFRDDILKIDIQCRVIFKKKREEIHYPFAKDGTPKFDRIREIIYRGLTSPLPRGFIKDYRLGYGFTKVLSPILYQIDKELQPSKLIVSPRGKNRIYGKTVYLNYADLNKVYPKMDSLLQRHVKEKETTAKKFLAPFFSQKFRDIKSHYVKGTIYTIISDQIVDDPKSLSREDFDAVLELTLKELKNQGIESKKVILQTREKIERRFLEDTIASFKKLLERKLNNNKLEKDWESLLKENPWIISNLFATPVFFFQNQAYAGGKEINNANGKVTDFLYKNNFTDNISIVELKTHKTDLLTNKPYRGKDVFSLSHDLSGAVNQVLDQRQNLIQEFVKLRTKEEWFESYNPKCLVIAGTTAGLPEYGIKSFEIFRNNLHGVEIVTFNEVLKKLEFFHDLIKNKRRKKNKKTIIILIISMNNLKQHLIEGATKEISNKEQEIRDSDQELEILSVKVKVENKTIGMQDLKEYLREDFKYSTQALESMLVQEQQRNAELKKDLEMLKYRKAVTEGQFSDNELNN